MRYLHKEFDPIAAYIRHRPVILHLLDCGGQNTETIEHSALEDYFERTHTYWGTAPKNYVYASFNAEIDPIPLGEALSRVEDVRTSNGFLLVGYNDGGLISISKEKLPFQDRAERAPWWRI
jgi:hypothetical protein